MQIRSVTLPQAITGRLWLSAMPGRHEPWSAFVAQAVADGLDELVCLTGTDEMPGDYLRAATCGPLPFRWRHMPVRNLGVPDDPKDFQRQVRALAQALRAGDTVQLHCAAGIGRTGSTAACVLKALGLSTGDALERVRQAGSNPQNADQAGWVAWF